MDPTQYMCLPTSLPEDENIQFLKCWVILKHQMIYKIQKLSRPKSHIPFQKTCKGKLNFPYNFSNKRLKSSGMWHHVSGQTVPKWLYCLHLQTLDPKDEGTAILWNGRNHSTNDTVSSQHTCIFSRSAVKTPILQLFTQTAILNFTETTCQADPEMKMGKKLYMISSLCSLRSCRMHENHIQSYFDSCTN